jgi:hypothetical protein
MFGRFDTFLFPGYVLSILILYTALSTVIITRFKKYSSVEVPQSKNGWGFIEVAEFKCGAACTVIRNTFVSGKCREICESTEGCECYKRSDVYCKLFTGCGTMVPDVNDDMWFGFRKRTA